jgi:hypothetical protein
MSEKIFDYKVDLEITADGRKVETNEFVQTILQSTIKGMISALRISENAKEINLKVTLKKKDQDR